MRGEFRYSPNVLDLRSVALDGGPDMQVFLQGRVAPLADAVYNLRVQSRVGLNRVRELLTEIGAAEVRVKADTTTGRAVAPSA